MSSVLRSPASLATAWIAAGVLATPGAAYAADTTTHLSPSAMTTALKAVSANSTAAARAGWRASVSLAFDKESATMNYAVDPAGGVAASRIRTAGILDASYAVAGKGMYQYAGDPTTRAAVKMMRRPSVQYVFTPKPVNVDAYVKEETPLPATLLAEGMNHAGTRTSHDDGSTDYTFKDDPKVTVALHVDRAGVLTSVRSASEGIRFSLAYRYGAQRVVLPAASVTVDAATLSRAMAYLRMPAAVKKVADQGAAATRSAAKGQIVDVASLRTIVRRGAAAFNRSVRVPMMKVGDVSGGARVSATNPWTHEIVAYTVTASGRTVLVKLA